MKELRTEIEINANAEDVWKVLTDFASYPEWNPFIRNAEGQLTEGASLKVRLEPPGGRAMTFKPRVIRLQQAKELSWLGRLLLPGLFDGEHIFGIVQTAERRVLFQQRERFRGIFVPLLWRGLDTKTRRGFELMNESLKRRAEQL